MNEIQDLLAWKECYGAIHKIENTVKDLREKIQDLREFHLALSQNKTTLKGLWLKIIREEVTDVQVMAEIVQKELEVEDWLKLLDYI